MKPNINSVSQGSSNFDYFCTALLLGSIWGFFEVVFKDVIGMGGKPFASAIMTGIGIAVMSTGYGIFKKNGVFLAVSIFTIFTRMLIVPVLGCSPMCRANSVVALLLLGASTTLAFGVYRKFSNRTINTGGLVAGVGVFISGLSFYYVGMACAPCPYLLTFAGAGGLAAFVQTEVLYWTLFSMVLFYPGYIVGNFISSTLTSLRVSSPVFYYAGIISASFVMMLFTGFILVA